VQTDSRRCQSGTGNLGNCPLQRDWKWALASVIFAYDPTNFFKTRADDLRSEYRSVDRKFYQISPSENPIAYEIRLKVQMTYLVSL
jgi:hypothetical protein